MYQHYMLFFKPRNTFNNCFVLDTQKRKYIASVIEGSELQSRRDYSLSYWKDNVFVLFGGKFQILDSDEGTPAFGVQLLEVNNEDSQMSFTVKPLNREKTKNTTYPAQIYKDNMYVLEGFGTLSSLTFKVSKFDLNANKWSKCEIQGEAPKPRHGAATALFKNKIYIFGGYLKVLGGFFAHQPVKDVFTLDLDNMQWNKVYGDNFPDLNASGRSTAEVIGEKIYIQHDLMNEFIIFDPANNTLQFSQGVSPKSGWKVRSFQNQSLLFRFTGGGFGSPYIEFQEFLTAAVPNQTLTEARVEQGEPSGTQLVQSKKNILSQSNHMNLLWKEKPFADVTFIVGNEEIQAHRIILIKCHFFENMFNSGMMEASSNKINVPNISPTNFKAILEYIYFGQIDLTEQLALDLILLANMYCMYELEADCDTYLCNHLTAENLLKIIKVNETADSAKIEDYIVSFLIDNIETLQQEINIRDVPHELLAQAIIRMKQRKLPSKQTQSFFN